MMCSLYSYPPATNLPEDNYLASLELLVPPEEQLRFQTPQGFIEKSSKSAESISKAIIKANFSTRVGHVQYSKGGFPTTPAPLSEIFCDNFCAAILTNPKLLYPTQELFDKAFPHFANSPYSDKTEHRGKTNQHMGGDRKILSDILIEAGFAGIQYSQCKPISYKARGGYNGVLVQKFKVAVPEMDYRQVLQSLRSISDPRFEFLDIDFTQDFSGCMSRSHIENEMISYFGFRKQGEGYGGDDTPTILHNQSAVGLNCITWMYTSTQEIRAKIYNKFAQSLESGAVRDGIGSHLFDWVNNPGFRLNQTIQSAVDKGLTRVELTFYNKIPHDYEVDREIEDASIHLNSSTCFDTSIHQQWANFMEVVKISDESIAIQFLDKEDPTKGELVVCNWYNEVTEKIGGHISKTHLGDDLYWAVASLTFARLVKVFYVWRNQDPDNTLSVGIKAFAKPEMYDTYITNSKGLRARAKEIIAANPEDRGLHPIFGMSPKVLHKKIRTTKILGSIYYVHPFTPDFPCERKATRGLISAAKREAKEENKRKAAEYVAELSSEIQRNWEECRNEKLRINRLEKELRTRNYTLAQNIERAKFTTISDAFRSKIKVLHVQHIGFKETRYGICVVLFADEGDFYGNSFITRYIASKFPQVGPHKDGVVVEGMQLKIELVREGITQARHKYIEVKIDGVYVGEELKMQRKAEKERLAKEIEEKNNRVRQLLEEEKKLQIKAAGRKRKRPELIKLPDLAGSPNSALRLESLEIGFKLNVVGVGVFMFRGTQNYYIQTDTNEFYRSNFFLAQKLEKMSLQQQFTVVIAELKTTKSKNKEAFVHIESCG